MAITSLRIAADSEPAHLRRAVALMTRVIEERCGSPFQPAEDDANLHTVHLKAQDTDEEWFSIGTEPGSTLIEGASARGLLFGIGKFLHTSTYAEGHFEPSTWQGRSQPECPVRILYLATHFHNFYQDAPLPEVEQYIEDMALWGYNTVAVWFDRHEFNGIDDPAAADMLERLTVLLQSAMELGLQSSLIVLANEGYANSPRHLRADYTGGHDGYREAPYGHYHVELCPSKPGALSTMEAEFEEVMGRLAPLGLDYVIVWPYDQGGCTCSECAPWGANGFLRSARPLVHALEKASPRTKVILSTWYFDRFTDGEWEGLRDALSADSQWVDYLLAGDYGGLPFPDFPVVNGAPANLPMLCFPEISMNGMSPWGGFGANLRPSEIQQMWQSTTNLTAGGAIYSEGIFEDLNKVVVSQLFWGYDGPIETVVRDYARFEFGPGTEDSAVRLVELLETSSLTTDVHYATNAPVPPDPAQIELRLDGPSATTDVLEIARDIDGRLSPTAKRGWRWRIVYLRSLIQDQIRRQADRSRLKPAFDELTSIYHAAQAEPVVRPPL